MFKESNQFKNNEDSLTYFGINKRIKETIIKSLEKKMRFNDKSQFLEEIIIKTDDDVNINYNMDINSIVTKIQPLESQINAGGLFEEFVRLTLLKILKNVIKIREESSKRTDFILPYNMKLSKIKQIAQLLAIDMKNISFSKNLLKKSDDFKAVPLVEVKFSPDCNYQTAITQFISTRFSLSEIKRNKGYKFILLYIANCYRSQESIVEDDVIYIHFSIEKINHLYTSKIIMNEKSISLLTDSLCQVLNELKKKFEYQKNDYDGKFEAQKNDYDWKFEAQKKESKEEINELREELKKQKEENDIRFANLMRNKPNENSQVTQDHLPLIEHQNLNYQNPERIEVVTSKSKNKKNKCGCCIQ
jgi:hypothetical protein